MVALKKTLVSPPPSRSVILCYRVADSYSQETSGTRPRALDAKGERDTCSENAQLESRVQRAHCRTFISDLNIEIRH